MEDTGETQEKIENISLNRKLMRIQETTNNCLNWALKIETTVGISRADKPLTPSDGNESNLNSKAVSIGEDLRELRERLEGILKEME